MRRYLLTGMFLIAVLPSIASAQEEGGVSAAYDIVATTKLGGSGSWGSLYADSDARRLYIPRTGQINTWDNPLFVEAIEKTGRKTLAIAGTLTSVCLAFPAISAINAGYKVYCVVDASGNWNRMATDTTIARIAQAGAIPTDTFAMIAELMRTWNRPEGSRFAEIIAEFVPEYRCLMESYAKAQSIAKEGPETHLDKYR